MSSAAFYNTQGAEGLAKLARRWKVSDDIRTAKELTARGQKVLDLACGYGRVAIPLARAGRIVTGIDVSDHLIGQARRRARAAQVRNATFDVGDMADLPYGTDSLDVVVCFWNSFNDILTTRKQLKVLNEIFRVLNVGGMAFLVLRDGENTQVRAELAQHGKGPDGRILSTVFPWGTHEAYIHDRESLRRLCSASRFKNFRVTFRAMNARRRIVAFLYA